MQQWLEDLRVELDEYSFQQLLTKVDEERKNQELLHEVRPFEKAQSSLAASEVSTRFLGSSDWFLSQ